MFEIVGSILLDPEDDGRHYILSKCHTTTRLDVAEDLNLQQLRCEDVRFRMTVTEINGRIRVMMCLLSPEASSEGQTATAFPF